MDSILRPGSNCCAIARAERVALLIDSEAYFQAFFRAALNARHSIIILGWDFDSRTRLHFDPVGKDDPPPLLGDFLNHLVHRRRGLQIRILNWDCPMAFGTDRELCPLYGFGWTPAGRVHMRYDDTHPFAGSQHQKVVVIDDAIAFAGGIDLTLRRWDTIGHRTPDERRMVDGAPYPPVHDLMIMVDDEAASALGNIARARWLHATGKELRPCPAPAGNLWPEGFRVDISDVEVGISRTAPPCDGKPAVREVERLYLDMIAAACRTLYIENQYYTSPIITTALEQRLTEPDGPEVVLVLRLLSHGWLEEHTMHVLRCRLLARLFHADHYGRLRVCYPDVPNLDEGCCLDVHSKLMIADNSLLRIGSSNLSNRSMGVDSECDVLIEARDKPAVAAAIQDFRDRLLAEHLDCQPAEVRARQETGGSLCAAIDALEGRRRTLRKLEDIPEWSDTVIELASVADPNEPIAHDFLRIASRVSPEEDSGPAWSRLIMLAAAILCIAALWRYTPLAEIVTPEDTIAWARIFGGQPWAPFAIILAYTPACFILFPRPLITLAAVIAFGPWRGFFCAMTGILIATAATYFAGTFMRRDTVRRLAGRGLDHIIEVMRKRGLLAIALLRLVPIAPFAVEGIVAGAVRLKLRHLLCGTAMGMLPGTLATTVFGYQLESAFGNGGVNWWVVAAIGGALVGSSFAVRRWLKNMAGGTVATEPR